MPGGRRVSRRTARRTARRTSRRNQEIYDEGKETEEKK